MYNYSYKDVLEFINDEDVKFIRLAFCDIYGNQKNVSIMPDSLTRAFEDGISFDASAVLGFDCRVKSDLLLFPIPSTINILPWRPSQGKVVRMFCDIKYPDGTPFENDSRFILKKAVQFAKEKGINVNFGSEFEFYLFKTDDDGYPTGIPFDNAGYMDVAPEDKGENIRREICLTLLEMGILPESSHHEEGPGQNEIDFRYSDAISAADNAMNFITVVKAAAAHNGLYASFMPKPIKGKSGSGMHINISIKCDDKKDKTEAFMAGIMEHIREITMFLNPCDSSYERFGEQKAPKYITWSPENRSQLIRIPAAKGDFTRIELRSPDPMANPYLAYALIIYAGIDGIENHMQPPYPANMNLYKADSTVLKNYRTLPLNFAEAYNEAKNSAFVAKYLPEGFADYFAQSHIK